MKKNKTPLHYRILFLPIVLIISPIAAILSPFMWIIGILPGKEEPKK